MCVFAEYAIIAVQLLGGPHLMISNYPLTATYVDSLLIPSPTSYVPNTITGYSKTMSFIHRLINTIVHHSLNAIRLLFTYRIERSVRRLTDYADINIRLTESMATMLATPAEMLLDLPRPISFRTKYLGCDYCTAAMANSLLSNCVETVDLVKKSHHLH